MVDFNDEADKLRERAKDEGWADQAESEIRDRTDKGHQEEDRDDQFQAGQNSQPDQ
jgi:hypothetical protein